MYQLFWNNFFSKYKTVTEVAYIPLKKIFILTDLVMKYIIVGAVALTHFSLTFFYV